MSYADIIARIEGHATAIEWRRTLLGVTLPFFILGFTIGLVLRALWTVGVYLWSAAAVGFEAGFRPR
ncbi:MAG: hypothetical protein L0Z49_01110 [Actinobacteria bacterium]|nr:hypothetical protein [Actinomycetota bacterium]